MAEAPVPLSLPTPRGRAAGRGRAQEVARAAGGGRLGARDGGTPVRGARATPAGAPRERDGDVAPGGAPAVALQMPSHPQNKKLNATPRNLVSWRLRILSSGQLASRGRCKSRGDA